MTIERQYGEGFIYGSVMEMISGKEDLQSFDVAKLLVRIGESGQILLDKNDGNYEIIIEDKDTELNSFGLGTSISEAIMDTAIQRAISIYEKL